MNAQFQAENMYTRNPIFLVKIEKFLVALNAGKSLATCQKLSLFALEGSKMRCRLGLCPGPRWRAYSAPPDPLIDWGGYNPTPDPTPSTPVASRSSVRSIPSSIVISPNNLSLLYQFFCMTPLVKAYGLFGLLSYFEGFPV